MSSPTIPIKITISSPSSKSIPLSLHVKLENTSSSPIYILTWSSPLDHKALALGVFSFTSVSTGEEVRGLGLMFRRKTPDDGYFRPSDDVIVRIEAGGSVEKEVEVGGEMMLERGERYAVKAKGRWMGVWVGEKEKLGYDIEGADVLMGEFETDAIEIEEP